MTCDFPKKILESRISLTYTKDLWKSYDELRKNLIKIKILRSFENRAPGQVRKSRSSYQGQGHTIKTAWCLIPSLTDMAQCRCNCSNGKSNFNHSRYDFTCLPPSGTPRAGVCRLQIRNLYSPITRLMKHNIHKIKIIWKIQKKYTHEKHKKIQQWPGAYLLHDLHRCCNNYCAE